MRPGLLLVTCPTDAGYRARLFLPIGSIALVEGTSLDPYRQDVRSPLPRRLAVFFLSGDAHESMTVTSVSDDARLAVRTLDDERGDRRKVLAKGGDSAALGLGDFVEFASHEDPMRSTWVYQYVHFSDHDKTPLPPSPFLAPSPPWLPRLTFDLAFLKEGSDATVSVQLVKGRPRLMRWADGALSVVFVYGGTDALWLLCLGDAPIVLHDKNGREASRSVRRNDQAKINPDMVLELRPGVKCELRGIVIGWAPSDDVDGGDGARTPEIQDNLNPAKKDGRRRCGDCDGCKHPGGKCFVLQAKWKRIKEEKEATREARGDDASTSEASENEGPDDPDEVAAAKKVHANAQLCAAGLPGLAHYKRVVSSIELRNQRAGVIERTFALKRKLLRDFVTMPMNEGSEDGDKPPASVHGSSQPQRSTDSQDSAVAAPGPEWSDNDPLSALADAMIEEVSTKVSRYGDADFPIELQ